MDERVARILGLERTLAELMRAMSDLAVRLAAAEQNKWNVGGGGGGPGGGSGGYYGCILSGALSAGSAGAPASIAAQTVWQLSSGARSNLAGTYTVYNDTGSGPIAANSQVLLAGNPDGSFTVIAVACTANP